MTELNYATFGGGCFWCTEAVFQQLEGVETVEPGYCGGEVENPTYQAVCGGNTGHAEVIQIGFDPDRVGFADLLSVFFQTHDPTTLNRQGNDVGTQYRSVIFFHDAAQREAAEQFKADLDGSNEFGDPIVTEISPAATFYRAEDYHHNYFRDNPTQGYCAYVVRPKVDKFRGKFKSKLKRDGSKP
ncbi:MAG: peptide-methionine (S)-S-oxide reductase MsrA [Planctomycetota bacterium]|nr:peptide-methionine (S)-S-oxide reductase MsrA [Planctomycetota bacterium]